MHLSVQSPHLPSMHESRVRSRTKAPLIGNHKGLLHNYPTSFVFSKNVAKLEKLANLGYSKHPLATIPLAFPVWLRFGENERSGYSYETGLLPSHNGRFTWTLSASAFTRTFSRRPASRSSNSSSRCSVLVFPDPERTPTSAVHGPRTARDLGG